MSSIVLQVADRLVDLQDVSGSPGVGNAPVWDGSSFVLTTLRSAAFLQAGAASGVAQLDSGGKVPAAQLPQSIVDGLHFAGLWNASTNTPTLQSGVGTKGAVYKVSVSGGTVIDGIGDWEAGDSLYFDGTTWDSIDGLASEVLSVAGRVGNVVLAMADITDLPALSAVAGSGQYADLLGLPSLFSGDFRDLSNPPPMTPLGSTWNHDAQQGASFGSIQETLTGGPTWQYLISIQVNDVDAYGNNIGVQNAAIAIGDFIYAWHSPTSYAIAQVTGISPGGFGSHSNVYATGAGLLFWTGAPPASGTGQLRFGLAYRPIPSLATVATTGAYSDLTGTPDLSVYALASSLASYVLASEIGEGPGDIPTLTDWYVNTHSPTPVIDWNNGPFQLIAMEENQVITFANVPAVARPLCLRLIQSGSGGYVASFDGALGIHGTTAAQGTAVGNEDVWGIQRISPNQYNVCTIYQIS